MLDFATRYLKIGDTNNQSFVYHFVGNFSAIENTRELFDDFACVKRYGLLQGGMRFGRINSSVNEKIN